MRRQQHWKNTPKRYLAFPPISHTVSQLSQGCQCISEDFYKVHPMVCSMKKIWYSGIPIIQKDTTCTNMLTVITSNAKNPNNNNNEHEYAGQANSNWACCFCISPQNQILNVLLCSLWSNPAHALLKHNHCIYSQMRLVQPWRWQQNMSLTHLAVLNRRPYFMGPK